MSYEVTVTGSIKIDPPLNHKEIREAPCWDSCAHDITMKIDEKREESDTGTLIQQSSSALIACERVGYSAYHVEDNINEMIRTFPDHTFSGHFECQGREVGDLWRIAVKDNKAVQVRPTIVWPD